MILRKFIFEQFICGKCYTIIDQKRNIKITMRKEEIFTCIEKIKKKKKKKKKKVY